MKTFKEYISELTEPADMPAIPAERQARRRRYSHKFTADKVLYLDYDKQGKPYWRKKSTGSIVFFGKQQKKRKDDKKPIK